MAGIKIRNAGARDFNGIFSLLEQLWDYKKLNKARVKKAFLASIKEKNHKSFIAVSGGRVTGYAGTAIHNNLWQSGRMCHLNELVVDETIRGKGIGSRLLKKVESYAVRNKCRGIDLESAMRRKQTHKFYNTRKYEAKALFFTKLFYPDR
jgi:(aminoalkyl)phosphonate N-acetyltransferase